MLGSPDTNQEGMAFQKQSEESISKSLGSTSNSAGGQIKVRAED